MMWLFYITMLYYIIGEDTADAGTCEDSSCSGDTPDIRDCFIDIDNNRICPEGLGNRRRFMNVIPNPQIVERPAARKGIFGDVNYDVNNIDVENDRDCDDRHKSCEEWAARGDCNTDPRMEKKCPKSCSTCRYLRSEWRCRIDPTVPAFVHPGDVDRMFTNMIENFTIYNPIVLHEDPWVVVLDEFLSKQEVADFIAIGAKNFRRSIDAGKMDKNGIFESVTTDVRTSENAWCISRQCYMSNIVQRINRRITSITGVPQENFEYHQVLRYQPGQYYRYHHDFIVDHNSLPIGPRVYTFFMYLSDVEKGGETSFPGLNIKVRPKAGRAVIWPSVISKSPFAMDHRTGHEALPVIEGIKYAVNSWIHMFNFQDAYYNRCSG